MRTSDLIAQIETCVVQSGDPEGYVPASLPGLGFVRHSRPTGLEATVYEPVVCLILQGRKATAAGPMAVDFGPGECLIVSHDIPVVSQVTECPYLALVLALDVGVLRSLVREVEPDIARHRRAVSLDVAQSEAPLLDALGRYVALIGNPSEERVLGTSILREIHFRLLMAPEGGMLTKLLANDSNASHIARAIRQMRRDFRLPMTVSTLASGIGMSESSFHRHFKTITGTTPLQYQKNMRLFEARRLMSNEGYRVSRAAHEVGYASATQFSRDYSRKFGVVPRMDAKAGQPVSSRA